MTGCIITLIITIIGLIGYAVDEINRRRKEIAIRKVLGGNHSDIQKTILSDIIKIIIPALLIGNILSMLFANQWLQSFDQKQNLSAWIFIASSLAIIVIIYSLVKYKINMEMRSGIIDKLKTE